MAQTKTVGAEAVPTVSRHNDNNPGEAITAMQNERQMSVRDSFRFWPKAILFSFIISLAIIMEGYDTNLMSNFYAFPAFMKRYGDQVDANGDPLVSARWQTIINNGTQAGSILGLILNGIITEWIGYKKTMIVAMVAMIGAVFIPFFSNGLPMFLAGALIQGIPWGIFQTLAVTYAADICPMSLRGYMTSWVNMCWVIGQLISSGMLRGLLQIDNQWGYRIPFAIQWVWPVPIIIGTLFAPESPWWLVRQNRLEDAREAVRKLTSPKSDIDFDLDAHIEMMRVTNQFEIEVSSGAHYWDCFRGVDLRRTEIACMVWLTQSFCGVPFMGYGTQFMINAGLSSENGFTMSLVQNCIGLIGCIIAWYIMTHIGRRTLYLAGLSAMFVILVVIGGIGIPQDAAGLPARSWAVGALIIVMLFSFQLSVGPSCYTLVAEMPSTRLRVKTVALSRAFYNCGGFIVNALQPKIVGKNDWNWGARGGFFWAGITVLFLTWTFFRLPEPFGLTYSEIDLLFEHRVGARHFSQEAADSLRPQLEEVANRHEKLAATVSHQEA
ncbi:sugar porter family MFS transporter [Colletotrichum fioriniae PJ7]|uniref:Sugar porter family MFS transporter n=1 Tax=Colletotrichum fioriniae PJ7 TaxID=1445577 RepID=A0A010S6C3_9PEZI|nr:sugar porter family MFS transporter [Colletotrichum fioriniae PJ7]